MKIKGLGGTDFRPVFRRVDEMIHNKEFINLKGLIYFTDGYGVFPERMPAYKTAFIFVEEGYESAGLGNEVGTDKGRHGRNDGQRTISRNQDTRKYIEKEPSMNIRQAKEQIKNAMTAYFGKLTC